jgi:hypothetical protein
MSEEQFCGVEVLLSRMKSHPEEFFESDGKRGRWAFMYKDYFRDSMSESEKGRILEALRTVRRMEFDAIIVKELMKDEQQAAETQPSPFGAVPSNIIGGALTTTIGAANTITSSNLMSNGSPVATQEDIARAIAKLEAGKVFK